MKKILITDLLILIIIASFFSIAYATNSSFIDAAQNAIDEYKPDQEVENDALLDYMNQIANELIYSNAILNHAQNAADKYWEAAAKEKEELIRFEASLQAEGLVKDLKQKLDVYSDSVQIDNKLYLKYSNTEKTNIYKLMTSNAQKIFEKNTSYFKKSGSYYYDTGKLRTLPIIYEYDVYDSELKLTSATEKEATFDVIINDFEVEKVYAKYTDGLKIVKKDGKWLIDSFKFKTKVETEDTYPEYVVIEEEKEKTENKQENNKTEETKKEENKKEETKKEETTKNEVNEVVNTNKEENVNVENNISNQTTDITTTEKQDANLFMIENSLYMIVGVLVTILIFIVYKVVKYSKKRNENNDKNLL